MCDSVIKKMIPVFDARHMISIFFLCNNGVTFGLLLALCLLVSGSRVGLWECTRKKHRRQRRISNAYHRRAPRWRTLQTPLGSVSGKTSPTVRVLFRRFACHIVRFCCCCARNHMRSSSVRHASRQPARIILRGVQYPIRATDCLSDMCVTGFCGSQVSPQFRVPRHTIASDLTTKSPIYRFKEVPYFQSLG